MKHDIMIPLICVPEKKCFQFGHSPSPGLLEIRHVTCPNQQLPMQISIQEKKTPKKRCCRSRQVAASDNFPYVSLLGTKPHKRTFDMPFRKRDVTKHKTRQVAAFPFRRPSPKNTYTLKPMRFAVVEFLAKGTYDNAKQCINKRQEQRQVCAKIIHHLGEF